MHFNKKPKTNKGEPISERLKYLDLVTITLNNSIKNNGYKVSSNISIINSYEINKTALNNKYF